MVITLIIPLGVFMRYAMNKPIGWPEPAAIILMVMFSFIGGAAVYRANVHIAVEALMNAVKPGMRHAMKWGVTACMTATAAFMLVRGRATVLDREVLDDGRVPGRLAGTRLPADPGGGPLHAAVHPREGVGRRAARRPRSCTATRPWRPSRWMPSSSSVPSRSCARSACRSPTRSASSAIVAALWIDIPLEAVMLKISDGTDDWALLAIPFFVLAGGIMAEGGMAMRLINLARVFVGAIRGGLALVNIMASTLFGCVSGSSVADTAAIGSVMIPQMKKAGFPARIRDQRHDLRVGAGVDDPAVAQRGDLLDRRGRHRVGREPVPRRRLSRPPVRRSASSGSCC